MNRRLAKLLYKILSAYGVLINYQTVEKAFLFHPEYPSIKCISDVLDSWKVKHVVVKLTMEKLRALDVPVISFLKKGEYIWITRITDSAVYYWNATKKEKK